jgi:hypothetical protein
VLKTDIKNMVNTHFVVKLIVTQFFKNFDGI